MHQPEDAFLDAAAALRGRGPDRVLRMPSLRIPLLHKFIVISVYFNFGGLLNFLSAIALKLLKEPFQFGPAPGLLDHICASQISIFYQSESD